MKPIKQLSIALGEQMMVLSSSKHSDLGEMKTPLYLDEENKRAVQHLSSTRKTVVDLSKVMLYTYELEEPVVSQ